MKVVAIDQGTTATKSFTLDGSGRFESITTLEHKQIYPKPGWVEHDPEELLSNVKACLEAAGKVDAIGIANQDRKSTRLNSSHIQKSRMPSSA